MKEKNIDERLAPILYIGDNYIADLEELRDVFKRIKDANENTKNRFYDEIKALFYDGVLQRWLEKGGDEEQLIAGRIGAIDKNDNESNIQGFIEGTVTKSQVDVKRPLGKYLQLISESYSINRKNSEPVPPDSVIRYSTGSEVGLDISFKFKCIKSAMERFVLQLKTNGECVISEPEKIIDVSDYIEGTDYHIRYADIKIPFDTESIEFRLVADGEDVCIVEFLGDADLTFAVPNGKDDTGVEFKMIKVRGDTFNMSSKYKVTLSDYYIAEVPVTQKLWKVVMRGNSRSIKDTPSNFKGAQNPVENVSWDDICQSGGFLERLNDILKDKLPSGMRFSLPTEAQWEFAARGGTKSKGYSYSGSSNIDEVAWYSGNSGSKTHPVKDEGKIANELGIYDMSGNVWEWCQDWYDSYPSAERKNPKGPSSGSDRVSRGGSWCRDAGFCTVSSRNYWSPDYRGSYLGFRLVLSEL